MKRNLTLVSVFDNYFATKPTGEVNLLDWFIEKNKFTPVVDLIRSTLDKTERSRLKAQLPAITPSGIFVERKANKLVAHSGIICIDIDGKDNLHISDFESLKLELSTNKHILFCALSVSGNGLFCFIPIAYPEKHKEHFYSLQEDFKALGIAIDKACSDVSRLRGYSYDCNPYINHNAEKYVSILENSLNIPERKPRVHIGLGESQSNELKTQLSVDDLKSVFLKPTHGYIQVKVESKSDIVREILGKVIESKIDITDNYDDWITICFIIKNLFGEDGRRMFHDVSKFNSNYCFEMADKKYSSCREGECLYNSRRLIEIVNRYGIY
jgi:hypothetical protein